MFVSSGYSLKSYGRMLEEGPRRNTYVEALRRSIFPGCTVLEIGTGPGFFAFLAAQLGAAKIYAVEPDRSSLEAARLCAADNAGSERIDWMEALSTEIDLPERVDVVLSDLRGCLPTYNFNIDSMIDARRRHLKPGGTLIPRRDVLRIAPVQSTSEYAKAFRVWSEPTLGVDLSAARRFVVNESWRTEMQPERLLAPAGDVAIIDYTTIEDSKIAGTVNFEVEQAGTLHGWLLWFDADLADGAGFSNGPDLPLLVYGRAFLPVERPLDVVRADRLSCEFTSRPVSGRTVTRWTTSLTPSEGASVRFDQSSFRSKPLVAQSLARMTETYVPVLGDEGQIDLAILTWMQHALSVRQIAQNVSAKFPQRFRQPAEALAYVAGMSGRYAQRGAAG